VINLTKGNIRKILVFRTDRIGDILLSIPAIRALKQSFFKAQISVVLQSPYACLLEENSDIDEIITYRLFSRNSSSVGLFTQMGFFVKLQDKRREV